MAARLDATNRLVCARRRFGCWCCCGLSLANFLGNDEVGIALLAHSVVGTRRAIRRACTVENTCAVRHPCATASLETAWACAMTSASVEVLAGLALGA